MSFETPLNWVIDDNQKVFEIKRAAMRKKFERFSDNDNEISKRSSVWWFDRRQYALPTCGSGGIFRLLRQFDLIAFI